MYSDNKQIRDVADVAARIMYGQQPVTEKLHPNQQQLDVHEPEKDELTADDFKKLRGKKEVKKEEVELDEKISISYKVPTDNENFGAKPGDTTRFPKSPNITRKMQLHRDVTAKAVKSIRAQGGNPANHPDIKINKEEVEELDELSRDTLHSYVKKSFSDKEKPNLNTPERQKGLRKATSRLYKEDEELDEEDAYEKDRYAVKNGKAVKDNPTHQGSPNYKDQPHHVYATSAENALKNHTKKEEVEQMDEVKMADLPSTKVQGRSYGSSRPEPHALDVMKGPTEKQLLGVKSEKKKKFSEMVNLYQEKGLKSLSEMLVKEEPDNEQFTKELEDAKARSEGKKRNTEIAKGAVQAVKQEELDINDINGVQMSTIEERHMTDGEMNKRETIVKSMKKGMAGFKDRYGDRAKNVMYATANKQAMKD